MHLRLKPALLMTCTDPESRLKRSMNYLAVQPGLDEAGSCSSCRRAEGAEDLKSKQKMKKR